MFNQLHKEKVQYDSLGVCHSHHIRLRVYYQLLGRRPSTILDLLHPDISQRVENKQMKLINSKTPRTYTVGDKLYAKDLLCNTWIPVTVTKMTGPLSYYVDTETGIAFCQHADYL